MNGQQKKPSLHYFFGVRGSTIRPTSWIRLWTHSLDSPRTHSLAPPLTSVCLPLQECTMFVSVASSICTAPFTRVYRIVHEGTAVSAVFVAEMQQSSGTLCEVGVFQGSGACGEWGLNLFQSAEWGGGQRAVILIGGGG